MAIVTTGFFDGVHLGHRLVINKLVTLARERGEEAVIISFWPHPCTVLQNGARDLRLLTSLEEKKKLLFSLGVDKVEIIPFTKAFSCLSAKEYLSEYVKNKYNGTALILGYDNRIGGDLCTHGQLQAAAAELGLEIIVAERVDEGEVTISSTKIRKALACGEVLLAEKMLGHKYNLHGVVVAGNKLGRTIGFPTANIKLYEPLKLIPATGVYFTEVVVLGQKFYGMCDIGTKPTVSNSGTLVIETHIFGLNEDIYGLDINISLIRKIREEHKFNSIEEVQAQLSLDKEYCLSLI